MAIVENLYHYQGVSAKKKLAMKFLEYISSFPVEKLYSSTGVKQENGSYLMILDNEKGINEQQMFMECLMAPPEIAPLVVAKGAAGTGKTFCSLVMALEKLEKYNNNGIYRQLLVATPRVSVSEEEIGFLPGDIDEKVEPYLGGIKDNIKEIFRTASQSY